MAPCLARWPSVRSSTVRALRESRNSMMLTNKEPGRSHLNVPLLKLLFRDGFLYVCIIFGREDRLTGVLIETNRSDNLSIFGGSYGCVRCGTDWPRDGRFCFVRCSIYATGLQAFNDLPPVDAPLYCS